MEVSLVQLLNSLDLKSDNLSQACSFFELDKSDVSANINTTFVSLHRLQKVVTEIQQIREKREENYLKLQFLTEYFADRSTEYSSICDNLPKRFLEEQQAVDERIKDPSGNDKKNPVKLTKKGGDEKGSSSVPLVKYVTVEQFEAVPKYMKGRLNYDALNNSIEEFNKTLKSKYEFLRKGFPAKGSLADKNRYKELRSYETKATVGSYFLVADDMRLLATLKNENSRRLVMPILRHFQLIKEIRGPGSIVRFAVA